MADERVAGWQARRAVAERARPRALARGDARLAEALAAIVAGYDRWLARPEEVGLPSVPAPQPPVCSLVVRVLEDYPDERLPEPALEGVVVRLVSAAAPERVVAEGVTDRIGQARFELAPGRYWLYVSADGDPGRGQLPDGRSVIAWRPIELRAGIARAAYLYVPPR
jgi:hypothetical protein